MLYLLNIMEYSAEIHPADPYPHTDVRIRSWRASRSTITATLCLLIASWSSASLTIWCFIPLCRNQDNSIALVSLPLWLPISPRCNPEWPACCWAFKPVYMHPVAQPSFPAGFHMWHNDSCGVGGHSLPMQLSLASFLWAVRCLGHGLPFLMFCGTKQNAALICLSGS